MKGLFSRGAATRVVVLLLFSAQTLAQKYPAPFPRDGARKVQESDSFVVWYVTWEPGKSTGMHENPLDQVSVFLREGAVKVTMPDGTWSIEQERVGSIRFESKGMIDTEEGASDRPSRAMVFQLKDVEPSHWPITKGISGQYPRQGAIKLFETNRLNLWDDRREIGVRSPLHLHYNQVAGVWLEGGKIRSVSEGKVEVLSKEPGDVLIGKFRNVPHTEEAVEGVPRIICIELK